MYFVFTFLEKREKTYNACERKYECLQDLTFINKQKQKQTKKPPQNQNIGLCLFQISQ